MSEPSKSTKYDQALARHTKHETVEITTPIPKGAESMITKYHPDALVAKINEDLASGGYEAAPQIFKFEEGMVLEGILEGHGPDAEFTDQDTGEVSTVKTWIIANANRSARISILSSTQLDKKLVGFVGDFVKIARGKEVNIAGTKRRMTEYMVWGPRKTDGKERRWFEVPLELQLANERNHRALPAPAQAQGDETKPS